MLIPRKGGWAKQTRRASLSEEESVCTSSDFSERAGTKNKLKQGNAEECKGSATNLFARQAISELVAGLLA